MYGLELGFNCLANDSIRQELQLTSFKDGDLKILQANVNPQYVTNINQMLKFGFGPTAGLASIDNGTDSETLFTYGVGTSLSFNVNENIFVGAEFKYELTEDATFGDVTNNFDNIKAFTKIGYQF